MHSHISIEIAKAVMNSRSVERVWSPSQKLPHARLGVLPLSQVCAPNSVSHTRAPSVFRTYSDPNTQARTGMYKKPVLHNLCSEMWDQFHNIRWKTLSVALVVGSASGSADFAGWRRVLSD